MEEFITIRTSGRGVEYNEFRGEERDGKLWRWMDQAGVMVPAIDREAPTVATYKGGIGIAKVRAMIKAGEYDAIPADCQVILGQNPTGLVVMLAGEYDRAKADAERAKTAARDAAKSNGNRAWDWDIPPLEYDIERAEDADYYDPVRIIRAQQALAAAVKEWRETYPADAAKRDAKDLRDRARRTRTQAAEALHFSADGSYDAAARQKRHDEIIAEAETLETRAAELTK